MCDIKWDEDCGGARHPNNKISIPDKGGLHLSTRKILPWVTCGPYAAGRVNLPAIFIERMMMKAPVEDPSSLNKNPVDLRQLTHCLSVEYMGTVIDLYIDQGLLEA